MKRLTIANPRTAAVSVTGTRCELSCVHCQGHFLRGMDTRIDWKSDSFLVSGGCDAQGHVPIDTSLLRKLREAGKKVNVHSGLVTFSQAKELGSLADVVSFDFVSDNTIIKSIYHLDRTEDDFVESYRALKNNCRVVPHLLIGLGNELRSIRLLRELGEHELCLLILTTHPRIRNNLTEPTMEYIEHVLSHARDNFTKISLGCMRPPARKKEIDPVAIRYVDIIVNPHPSLRFSDTEILQKYICCSFE